VVYLQAQNAHQYATLLLALDRSQSNQAELLGLYRRTFEAARSTPETQPHHFYQEHDGIARNAGTTTTAATTLVQRQAKRTPSDPYSSLMRSLLGHVVGRCHLRLPLFGAGLVQRERAVNERGRSPRCAFFCFSCFHVVTPKRVHSSQHKVAFLTPFPTPLYLPCCNLRILCHISL